MVMQGCAGPPQRGVDQAAVASRCSRKLVRYLCKPYWRAGWCNRDIVHAIDHRPGVNGQAPGVLISPDRVAAPRAFIASPLAAWRDPERTTFFCLNYCD